MDGRGGVSRGNGPLIDSTGAGGRAADEPGAIGFGRALCDGAIGGGDPASGDPGETAGCRSTSGPGLEGERDGPKPGRVSKEAASRGGVVRVPGVGCAGWSVDSSTSSSGPDTSAERPRAPGIAGGLIGRGVPVAGGTAGWSEPGIGGREIGCETGGTGRIPGGEGIGGGTAGTCREAPAEPGGADTGSVGGRSGPGRGAPAGGAGGGGTGVAICVEGWRFVVVREAAGCEPGRCGGTAGGTGVTPADVGDRAGRADGTAGGAEGGGAGGAGGAGGGDGDTVADRRGTRAVDGSSSSSSPGPGPSSWIDLK